MKEKAEANIPLVNEVYEDAETLTVLLENLQNILRGKFLSILYFFM